jgi:oligosaccharide repeat unit polymerase
LDLQFALIADVLLVILSLWCVLQVSDASIFNPSLWWIALHASTVTGRLCTLNLGVGPAAVFGIRSDAELVNAAIAADLSLLGIVMATVFVARPRMDSFSQRWSESEPIKLNRSVGQIISILCFTIGTYCLLKFGYQATAARARGANIAAVDIGQFGQSAYPIMIAGFAVQGALIQLAMKGFTKFWVAVFLAFLVMTSINTAREAFLLTATFAFLILQTRRKKTNLPAKWFIGLLALGAIWFIYKPVRGAINDGQSVSQTIQAGQEYITDVLTGNYPGDTNFLDMQATYMAAADEQGKRFYGATLLPLIYLPIPRFVWPDKPAVNQYAHEIDTPGRPFAQDGMTPQLSGESYVNFGFWGCAIIPFLYMVGMQTAYRKVRHYDIWSAGRMIYLVYIVSMIQIFRDGLSSVVIFPVVVYLPLLGWGIISELLESAGRRLRRGGSNYAIPTGKLRTS